MLKICYVDLRLKFESFNHVGHWICFKWYEYIWINYVIHIFLLSWSFSFGWGSLIIKRKINRGQINYVIHSITKKGNDELHSNCISMNWTRLPKIRYRYKRTWLAKLILERIRDMWFVLFWLNTCAWTDQQNLSQPYFLY